MPAALDARTVLIVGGGSGIGRRIAEQAAAGGARIVLAGRDRERLATVAATLPKGADVHEADVSNEDDVARLLDAVGSFDHLVSTANRAAPGHVTELRREDVEEAFGAKLLAPLLLAKHGASRVAADGSFTFFSGFVAWRPSAGGTVQALVNGGLAHLTQALAVELAPVRVNAVAPGVVDSGVWDGMDPARRDGSSRASRRARSPAGSGIRTTSPRSPWWR